MRRNPYSYQRPPAVPRRVIKITGHETTADYSAFGSVDPYDNTCKYSWIEWHVDKETCGGERIQCFEGFADDTPAVEINGSTSVTEDTIVEAWLAPDGDHWLFNGATGTGSGGGQCCIGAPTGIFAFSQETCCDSTDGFSTATWFLFWDQDCVPYIFDDETEAVDAATGLGLDATVYGRCTSR